MRGEARLGINVCFRPRRTWTPSL